MVIKKKCCYHITFHMKFAQNKIVYFRQHFDETVKPEKKKIIIHGTINVSFSFFFFSRNQPYENISFRFGLEITEGFSECVTLQTRV